MADYRDTGLMLHAVHVDACPVFNPGDIVLAQGRKALNIHSNTCAFQYGQIRKILEAMEKGIDIKKLGLDLRDEIFNCRDYDCHGRFRIDIVSPSEIRALQRARLVAQKEIPLSEVGIQRVAADLIDQASPLAATQRSAKANLAAVIPAAPSNKPITVVATRATPSNASEPKTRTGYINRVTGAGTISAVDLPFLHKLDHDMVRALFAAGEQLEFSPGESIIQQGQTGTHLYILDSGSAKVVKRMPEGHDVELATLGSGQCVGEMSLLSGEQCNASVVTAEPAVVVAIPMADLDTLMAGNPPLHRAFSSVFMERLKSTNVKLEEELARGMTGRLSMISLLEILQTLMMSKQTGTLMLARGESRGEIYIHEGQAQAVTFQTLMGEDAFSALARWTDGSFSFRQFERDDVEINIHRSTMQMMMDAARMMDEGSA